MKKLLLLVVFFATTYTISAQCTTTNATDCACEDGSDDCDLLPDITISWYALENYLDGPTEEEGIVYVTGSTPNIGLGSFTVRGVDDDGYRWFVCDEDTVSIYDPNANQTYECPSGEEARQIIFQRIYHKNGNEMSYWDHSMGAMAYHSNHSHNHFDEWGIFTLRLEDSVSDDPRDWPIVGSGAKVGFCLMDYYSCGSSSANNHCKDDNTIYDDGNNMVNNDFPNYGLGGGNYGCNMVEQGISSGYTDVYSEYLDGMWIDIPEGTCNGDYWIVYEVDPNEVVIEQDEENNWTAIPFTLTEQTEVGNPYAGISSADSPVVCEGEEVTLIASPGISYLWSNGEETQSITVGAGSYSVEVDSYCGNATSQEVVISEIAKPAIPTALGDLICVGESATLTATGDDLVWYDVDGDEVGTGPNFNTPVLTETTSFFVSDLNSVEGIQSSGAKPNNDGAGGFFSGDQHMIFDAYQPIIIRSVRVYADGAGSRNILLANSGGETIQSETFYIEDGESVIDINFNVPTGTSYRFMATGESNLFRNNEGVNYPYETEDVFSVTSSSAGELYYYFFYDWVVESGFGVCPSDLAEVVAEVEVCLGLDDNLDLNDNISIYPNPSDGTFFVDFLIPGTSDVHFDVVDLAGKVIYKTRFASVYGEANRQVSLPGVHKGIYIARFTIGSKTYFKKISIL